MEQTIINTGPVLVNWGVWSITQSIVNHTGRTDYQNYWAYFPINPNSLWTSGVSPQGGSAAWQGEVAPGVYGVQFYPENAKIFADPDKGWIAYTSLSDTVVFIRTFPIFDGEQYPDNGARVSVYVSSSSLPLYMEVEVKGPVVALAATGGNYTFTENWLAAKVRAPVLDADSVGAIAGRLSYNLKTQSLSAIYGVFYKGTAKVVFVDAQGNILTEGQSSYTITPLEEFQLQETVAIPGSAKTVEVLVYNSKDELVGVLESADVSQLITAVESKTPAVTSEFRLEANYPNPFNPSTSIRYHLPQAMHVDLSIYNVQGQRIQTLVCAYQTGGDYNVQWNGKVNGITAASGVYFARLSAEGSPGTNVQVQRMLLLK
jgi:flagellar hook assembly protein FlgD